MATYYWVGGTGSWTSSATTNWSSSSGGSGGAGAPTSADDVVFNSASNATAYTVTVSTGAVCNSITVSGPASGNVTIAGSAALSIYGSMTLAASGITRTYTGAITFASTATGNTVTQNGITFASNVTFSGTGSWSLGSAFSTTGSATFSGSGSSFSTADYAFTAGSVSATAGTLSLGASQVTISTSFAPGAGATLNAGTSTITFTGASSGGNLGGKTYNNVVFSSTSISTFSVSNFSSVNNLTITQPATTGVSTFNTNGTGPTVTGTMTVTGGGPTRRLLIYDSALGRAGWSIAAFSGNDIDFANIGVSGAAAPLTGLRLGNRTGGASTGNSGITFPASKTVYWNLAGTKNWYDTGWAATSGGTPADENFPLAQDIAVFDDTGAAGTVTVPSTGNWTIGGIDASARTSAMTLTISATSIFGGLLLGTGVTATLPGSFTFAVNKNESYSPGGNTFPATTFSALYGNNVTLLGSLTSSGAVSFSGSGLTTNGYNITATSVSISGSLTRTVNLGASSITCSSATSPWTNSGTNLTFQAASSTITLSDATNSSSRTFAGGGFSYGALVINGGAATGQTVTFSGNNSFSSISTNKTVAWTLKFTGGSANSFGTWPLTGTSGNVLTITSTNTTRFTLTYTGADSTLSLDYLNVSYSNARPANYVWFAGANSTDGGNNTGWSFTVPYNPTLGNFLGFFM